MNPTNPIKAYFKTRPETVAVYLFGSHATGKEHHKSDLDIAVLIDTERASELNKLRTAYHLELSRITRKDVDIIIMNTAGEILLKQIYERGRLLLVHDDTKLSMFNMIAYSRIAEFGYHHTKMQASALKSITREMPIG